MISCAMHQPHYFPWLGYLNKMACVDKFVILDEVQLERKSNMYRNKLSTTDGKEKFITVSFERTGYMERKFNEIQINNSENWQATQINFIMSNYKKAPFFNEIWPYIEPVFNEKFDMLDNLVERTVLIEKDLFDIKTEIIKQSTLEYGEEERNNELLIHLCKDISADFYLSGNGARKYMDLDLFKRNGIDVDYQQFTYPVYEQKHDFVPNLSALDVLFNCGIEGSRKILRSTVNKHY